MIQTSSFHFAFPRPIEMGYFIKREKRFTAYCKLDSGEQVKAHCMNTGSMKGLLQKDAACLLHYNPSPKRKLHYSWKAVKIGQHWIGIDTIIPNKFIKQFIQSGKWEEFADYHKIYSEKKFNDHTRFDLFLESGERSYYLEIKNVTLFDRTCARFPDAVTTRGQKHLDTLMEAKQKGYGAGILFFIQRTQVSCFSPAHDIDPTYALKLKQAVERGVDVFALSVAVDERGLSAQEFVPLVI